MKPANIKRVGVFKAPDGGRAVRIAGAFPDVTLPMRGTNVYLHIDSVTFGRLTGADQRAFSVNSVQTFNDLLEDLSAEGGGACYLNVGLEPTDGFDFCKTDHGKAVIAAAASELADLRRQAADLGQTLDIVVRYASEMNLGSYSGGDKNSFKPYKDTYLQVREALKSADTAIQVVFSPAINFETVDSHVAKFWPGDANVDVVGGTWYMNGETSRSTITKTINRMKKYVANRVNLRKPFGIDEIGAWNPETRDNNAYLAQMFAALGSISGADFDFVSMFFFNGDEGKKHWNTNPNPTFLN